jgi:hypothetical protein
VVIGSNRQKATALRHGILPRVLSLLGDTKVNVEIRQEACVVLGSLVKGTPENVRAVVDARTVPVLVSGGWCWFIICLCLGLRINYIEFGD